MPCGNTKVSPYIISSEVFIYLYIFFKEDHKYSKKSAKLCLNKVLLVGPHLNIYQFLDRHHANISVYFTPLIPLFYIVKLGLTGFII